MKILIVEDDHFYSIRLKEALEDNGYEVVCANAAQDVISMNLDDVAAVISDVMLPNDPSLSGISAEETRSGFQTGVALFRNLRREGFTKPLLLISSSGSSGESAAWAAKQKIPFIAKEDGQAQIVKELERLGLKGTPPPPRAFIVHGHDEVALAELKDYLQNILKWQEPVVLREQPSLGKTIIEKFEELAGRIDCVFVLLTPDDVVDLSTDDDRRRARQNVIFELGFFYAHMGRRSGRVIALRKGAMELPSDIHGIVWIDIAKGIKAAGEDIRKEVSHI